ncbi:MAG: phosphoribosylaminoimidazolesuccinocarboxamide synthase [Mycoplasmataceae bacterium]|jgi:phosphoribosylaminoimidazole-succinocarboxamide synthase|nr:phosphoribosylaminoimidazolesuccinocarboxamide synthase [Mycoplasmataceae bacterium]
MNNNIHGKLLYEGKAKQLFATVNSNEVIVHYKDSATAGNGAKKAEINDKGILNNQIVSIIYTMLNRRKIPTHFIKKLNDRDQLCKKVKIIPLEVIIRNVVAGSMAKRLGLKEGIKLQKTVFELSYKNDSLGDPLINSDHAIAIGIINEKDLKQIHTYALKINQILINFFKQSGIKLIDFKLEFGKNKSGKIILADEISPDTCRLWDAKTNEKLDKDIFRRDLGDLTATYRKLLKRVTS